MVYLVCCGVFWCRCAVFFVIDIGIKCEWFLVYFKVVVATFFYALNLKARGADDL